MKRTIIGAIVAMFAGTCLGGLDDPGAKVITVRTEIDRGFSAVFARNDSGLPEVDKIIREEKLKNTDSDGFVLGAYLGYCRLLDVFLTTMQGDPSKIYKVTVSEVKFKLCCAEASIVEQQRQLGLSTNDMAAAGGKELEAQRKKWKGYDGITFEEIEREKLQNRKKFGAMVEKAYKEIKAGRKR